MQRKTPPPPLSLTLTCLRVIHGWGQAELARAAVAVETGSPPADVGFTGITDARYYRNDARMPTVILGPGSLSVAHTADEWVAVDDLVAAARTYARLAVAYLGTT